MTDAFERLRRRVRELKADLHRIESACYPSGFCKERVEAMVSELAARGAPAMSALVEYGCDEIFWPTQRLQSEVFNTAERAAVAFASVPEFVAILAWLLPSEMKAALALLVSEEANDANALSHEERERRAAIVQSDLLAAERDESALAWTAQAQGLPVEHRAYISSLARIGLQLLTTPRAAPSPTTPPGWSWDFSGAS